MTCHLSWGCSGLAGVCIVPGRTVIAFLCCTKGGGGSCVFILHKFCGNFSNYTSVVDRIILHFARRLGTG